MPPYHHQKVRGEMIFHISMKEGLSERRDTIKWYKAAGAARGLRMANGHFEDGNPEYAKGRIIEDVEESIETYRSDEPLIMGENEEKENALALGFLFGLVRAYQIVTEESPTLAAKYGPEDKMQTTESFKWPPIQLENKVNA